MFQEYYEETILSNYSAATVSWIPSLQIFFMLAPVSFWRLLFLVPCPNVACFRVLSWG